MQIHVHNMHVNLAYQIEHLLEEKKGDLRCFNTVFTLNLLISFT